MTTNPSLSRYPQVDAWLSFEGDGTVVLRSGKVDIGQRVSAALILLAAEELDIDPARIRVAVRETGQVPDEGYTSGSRSMAESGNAIRLAAATARRYLLDRAREQLGSDQLEVSDGLVRARGTNRTATYGQLAGGQPLSIPVDSGVAVKPTAEHRVLGRAAEAPGLSGLVTGATRFVHDMKLPGMLHALVVRPPHCNARLEALDPEIDSRLRGGSLVRDGSFLAVAHEDEWIATQLAARVAAAARWTQERGIGANNIFERLVTNPRSSRPVIDGTAVELPVTPSIQPEVDATTIQARFQRPYQMHASIGPSAAMAHLDGDRLSIWTHSQGIYPLRDSIAEALGRAPELGARDPCPGCRLLRPQRRRRCRLRRGAGRLRRARPADPAEVDARRRARLGALWLGHGRRHHRKLSGPTNASQSGRTTPTATPTSRGQGRVRAGPAPRACSPRDFVSGRSPRHRRGRHWAPIPACTAIRTRSMIFQSGGS